MYYTYLLLLQCLNSLQYYSVKREVRRLNGNTQDQPLWKSQTPPFNENPLLIGCCIWSICFKSPLPRQHLQFHARTMSRVFVQLQNIGGWQNHVSETRLLRQLNRFCERGASRVCPIPCPSSEIDFSPRSFGGASRRIGFSDELSSRHLGDQSSCPVWHQMSQVVSLIVTK